MKIVLLSAIAAGFLYGGIFPCNEFNSFGKCTVGTGIYVGHGNSQEALGSNLGGETGNTGNSSDTSDTSDASDSDGGNGGSGGGNGGHGGHGGTGSYGGSGGNGGQGGSAH